MWDLWLTFNDFCLIYYQPPQREVQAQSEISHAERERTKKPTISVDVDTAHNYSGQYLNSMELAREKLRQYLCAKDPDARLVELRLI